MNPSAVAPAFPSLEIYIRNLKSEETEKTVNQLFEGLGTELNELQGNSDAPSEQLLEELCNRFDEVLHLTEQSESESCLSQKMKITGLPLLLRLIRLLAPFPCLSERRTDYLLFAVSLEKRLGAQEETLLTYYLHILLSSPNKQFDRKSADSFRQFYDDFVQRQEAQFERLLQQAIAKDRQIDKAALSTVRSALDRIDQLERWGVAPPILIPYYQRAKQALSLLSPQEGWSGVLSIRDRINHNIHRLGESERKEGATALESQQEALAHYHANFKHCIENIDPKTPEEVRELQERLFALFCTFFKEQLLAGPFMLLSPPFPEVNGEPSCTICLLGSASRQELSSNSDFEAFFLIKRERGALDNCLDQIEQRLHFLRHHKQELQRFLESSLDHAQELEKLGEMATAHFLDQLKGELQHRFQAATENHEKLFFKSLIGQLPKAGDREAIPQLLFMLQKALDLLTENHQLQEEVGSPSSGAASMSFTPHFQKAWKLRQEMLYSRSKREEEVLSPQERFEYRILKFLHDKIKGSFTNCSPEAITEQRAIIAQAIEELAIALELPVAAAPTETLNHFPRQKLLRNEEVESISFLFSQQMKGIDFAYFEQWIQYLKLTFFALGESSLPEGLESLKWSNGSGIHLDIPDFDGRGIQGVYSSPEAFAALQTPLNRDHSYSLEELTSPGTRGVPPSYWLLKFLPLEEAPIDSKGKSAAHLLYQQDAKEGSLSASYSAALEKQLGQPAANGMTVRQSRALSILRFRLRCFEEKGPFDPNGPIDIKGGFIELLYHAIGDLGNFFSFAETNTLDLINRLTETGKLSKKSQPLLKQAVADLYMMRIRNGGSSAEERKELQTIYWLILFPLYAIFKSAFNGSPLEELFVNIDLLDVAFREAIAPEGSDWRERVLPDAFEQACIDEQLQLRSGIVPKRPPSIEVLFHFARYLVDSDELSVDVHMSYYRQLFSRRLQPFRRRYLEGVAGAPDLHRRLAHHPNMYGYREIETVSREALSQELLAMTTTEQEEWQGISVEVKGTCFSGHPRYLSRSLIQGILNQEGNIQQGYGTEFTQGRVCRYQSGHCDLHFKQEPTNFEKQSPFHPGREQAASRLMMRLCGHGTSFSELIYFIVRCTGNEKSKEYFVLVSQTVKGEPLDLSKQKDFDPKRLTATLLTLPILVPGDGRAVNYVISKRSDEYGSEIEELVSIDNDVSLGQPAVKRGWFSHRVVCTLYSVLFPLFARFPLEKCAIEEFLQLHPHLLLLDWLYELVEWNRKSSTAFLSNQGDSRISPLALFDRGTGARLFLQMQALQQMLKQGGELNALELLKCVICFYEEKPTPIGKLLYSIYSEARTVEGLKAALERNPAQSISMSQSSMVNYQNLPNVNADLSNHLPENAIDEVLTLTFVGSRSRKKMGEKAESCFDVTPPIPLATQQMLLKTFLHQRHSELKLAYCAALDDTILIELITKSGSQLETLDVRHCPLISEAFLIPLAKQCPHLKELYISHCPNIRKFPNVEKRPFRSDRPLLFPTLQRLHVAHCAALIHLTPLAPRLTLLKADGNHRLKRVDLSAAAATSKEPTHLPLRHLNFNGSDAIPEEDIHRILDHSRNLTHLGLGRCTQLLDQTCVQGISKLKNLKMLNLEKCDQLSHHALCQTLSQLRELRELRLSGCSQIEEAPFCQMIKNLHQLEKLSLLNCLRLSGEQFTQLLVQSATLQSLHLTHLDLSKCGDWDAMTLATVMEKTRGVQSLNLSGCPHLNNEQLLNAIQQIHTLEQLDLAGCLEIREYDIVQLLSQLKKLKRLNLKGCTIRGGEVCEAIARHKTLKEVLLLNLSLSEHCQLTEELIIETMKRVSHLDTIDLTGVGWSVGKELFSLLMPMDAIGVISLEKLDASDCRQLEQMAFIQTLRKIRGVKELNLSANSQLDAGEVIDVIGEMVELQTLNLSRCNQLQGELLAKALEKLTSLTTLNLSWCTRLQGELLAKALEELTSLTTLNLSWCNQLQGELLAKALEELTALTTLNLSWCNQLQGELLAKALEKLTSLTTLNLSRCDQLQGELLIKALEKLTSLTTLHLSGCTQLQGELLAKALEKLTSLTTLDLSGCNQLEGELLAKALEELTSLTTLNLSWCNQLQGEQLVKALEKLTSLTTLNLSGCTQLEGEQLAKALEKLTSLTTLDLSGCKWLQGELLAKALEKLTSLTTLDLSGCKWLQGELLAKALEKLTALTTLNLSGCTRLQGELLVKALEKLTSLTTLNLSACNQLQGELLAKALEKFTALTTLNLSGCTRLQGELLAKALEKLTSLTTLNLSGCNQLEGELLAKALEKLTSLTTLNLSGCNQLQEELLAKALEKLTSLTTLHLSWCTQLQEELLAKALEKLTSLTTLHLSWCTQLQEELLAKALEKLTSLTTLHLSRCDQLQGELLAKALEKLTSLTTLDLSECRQLQGELLAKALEKLTSLTTLNLSRCNQLQEELLAKALEKLTALTTLHLSECTQLEGEQLAKALEKLTSLTTLDLSGCNQLQEELLAKALEKLTSLTTLNLSGCRQLEGELLAKALEKLTSLTTLNLSWCNQLQEEQLAKALEKLTSLTTLNLSGCNQLEGELLAKALEKLTSLTTLDLSGCRQLQGELLAKALEKLTSLTTLDLSGCNQLEGELLIKALEKLTSLTTLDLSWCRQLQGEALAKALEKLNSLTTLYLRGCNQLQGEALDKAIGKLQLISYYPPW